MTIIDPHTNRSTDHAKMLTLLRDWSSDRTVMSALLSTGKLEPGEPEALRAALAHTESTRGPTGLGDRNLAALCALFLEHHRSRRRVARRVAKQNGLKFREVYRQVGEMYHEFLRESGVTKERLA